MKNINVYIMFNNLGNDMFMLAENDKKASKKFLDFSSKNNQLPFFVNNVDKARKISKFNKVKFVDVLGKKARVYKKIIEEEKSVKQKFSRIHF